MIYESAYESAIEEKKLEDNFYKRMSLYLKSKSIDEYCVQRDLLNIKDNLIDEFWLWYMYKEKKNVLVGYWLLCMIGISALILFALPLIFGGGIWWVVSSTLAVTSFAFHIYAALCTSEYIKELGYMKVPYSISKDRDKFKDIDKSMSYKLMNNEN